jgi:N-acetyl-gamma-glutamyl-phosphate reductase
VYGLPENQRETIEKTNAVANPGCFATAIQLALLPLAKAGLIQEAVHVNATTGSTGAGVGLSPTGHFSWRNNNVSWYKPFTHQHLGEIGETLGAPKIYFLPQRGNFTRGIFASCYTSFEGKLEEVVDQYKEFYKTHPFTHVSDKELTLKQVVNTNHCAVHLHQFEDQLLITSVIDNLLKGASGQAIQNLNLIMGWEEDLGLQLKASVF